MVARIVLFAGLVLALASVGFLVFRAGSPETLDVRRDDGARTERTEDRSASRDDRDTLPRDRPIPKARDTTNGRSRENGRAGESGGNREEVFAGVRIRAFDTRGSVVSGAPIEIRAPHADNPDFEVLLGGPTATDERGEAEIRYADPSTALQMMQTSADGLRVVCALPIDDPPGAWLRQPQAPGAYLRLELPDEGLAWLEPVRVRVDRFDGNAAPGVDVVLGMRRANEPGRRADAGRARTDEEGIAELPRQGQRERLVAGDRVQSRLEFDITVDAPLLDPPTASVPEPDPRLVGTERTGHDVRLVLPAAGAVIASVYDAAGDIVDDAIVRVSYVPAESSAAHERPIAWGNDAELVDGKWRLAPIGTGLRLEVRAWYADGRAPMTTASIPGPAFDGEDVSVTLRFEEEFPFVTGRAVFPGAVEPIRYLDARVADAQANDEGERRQPFRANFGVEVASDGAFRFRFRGDAEADRPRVLEFTDRARSRIGRVSLPALGPGATVDLGTVEVRELPLLVAGRVVDETGLIVPNAVVRASEPVEGSDGRFREVNLATSSAGRDGHFEIRAVDQPRRVRLLASDRASRTGRTEVDAGRIDVEIVVRDPSERGGVVAGRVLLDDGISLDHVEVMLEGSDGSYAVRGIAETGGGFEFRGVAPGRVDLEVRTRPAKLPIERISDIIVAEGEASRDDRVEWIDLRGRLHYLRVRLVDGSGVPFARERIIVTQVGSTRGGSVLTDEDGHLAALLEAGAARVRLSSRTIRSTEIDFTDDDRSVVLERR